MKNKKVMWALIALVVVCAAAAAVYFGTRKSTTEGSKTYTVKVVHKDGSEKTYTYSTDEEYLGKALQNENLIEGEDGSYGLYVTTVDGETADYDTDQAYWALMDGDDYSATGVDTTPVEDGATYTWIYTADQSSASESDSTSSVTE